MFADHDLFHLEVDLHRAQRLATQPGVPQALAEDGSDVDIGNQQVFGHRRRPGHDRARGVEHAAVAVEDQLVLTPDGVGPDHERAGVHGSGRDHLLAGDALLRMEGGPVDVDQHLGAELRLEGDRSRRIPGVLTDRDAQPDTVDGEDRALAAGTEVALLVEHAVVRQVDLVVHPAEVAVAGHEGRVVDVDVEVHEPADHGDPPGSRNQPISLPQVVPNEGRLQKQVLGRVPGDRQLREDDQVGPLPPGTLDPLEHAVGVAVEIADGGVELCQRDPQ